jgi:quinol monooxygenase YgiN
MGRKSMVHVVAWLRIKEGKLQQFAEMFREFAITVRREKGCIRFAAGVDLDTAFPPQTMEKNVVTFLETWEDLDALKAHNASPHVQAHAEKSMDMVEAMGTFKVLQEL